MTRRALGALAALACAACPPPRVAAEAPAVAAGEVDGLLARAEAAFARRPDAAQVQQAVEAFAAAARGDARRTEGCVGVVRAAAWLLERGPADGRAALAQRALEAGAQCRARAPDSGACQYWHAVALGLWAREHPATALGELKGLVELLQKAAAAAPQVDDAGPARVLALVLLRAPGWPAGPGDAEAGLAHARQAVERAPQHPQNQLALGEALAATGDAEGAKAAYERAKALADALAAAGEDDGRAWAAEARAALERL